VICAAALLPLTASGQEHPDARVVAVDGSPYRMNPSGEAILATSLPSTLEHGQWQLAAAAHHFASSIVVATSSGERLRSILDNRQQLELGVAIGLFGFAELAAHWAVVPHQSATFPARGLGATDSLGVTHPVLRPKLRLLGKRDAAFSMGAEVPITLALWKPYAYMGRDGIGVHPNALVGWQSGAIGVAASLGVDVYPSVRIDRTYDGPRLTYQIALRYALPRTHWQASVEWNASHRIGDLIDRDESNGQVAGGVAYRWLRAWLLQASVGVGVLGGIGQAQYRVLASAAYRTPVDSPTKLPPRPDCARTPDAPGCEPDLSQDRDKDTLPDALDRCPDAAEDKDGFEDADGCPEPDNDSDGIPDTADSCPEVVGVEQAQGCPVAESEQPEPAADSGAPAPEATLQQDRITVNESIRFAFGDSKVAESSAPLLREVLAILETHPALKLQIEGHCDSSGAKPYNHVLSLRRANAVRNFLIEHAQDGERMARRLSAVGYGERRPVDTNDSRQGRAKNRHVAFVVTDGQEPLEPMVNEATAAPPPASEHSL
jgi:outer membrane protein OmpA-like peptidoglycan-associated protein